MEIYDIQSEATEVIWMDKRYIIKLYSVNQFSSRTYIRDFAKPVHKTNITLAAETVFFQTTEYLENGWWGVENDT